MTVVTESNFPKALPLSARKEYWHRVEWTLVEVFGLSATAAREYQRRINNSPVAEQVLAYHHDPLLVAADLAGIESLSQTQIDSYFAEMAHRDHELATSGLRSRAKSSRWIAELLGAEQDEDSSHMIVIRLAASFAATGVAIVSVASKIVTAQDLLISSGLVWAMVFGTIGALCALYLPWIGRRSATRTSLGSDK